METIYFGIAVGAFVLAGVMLVAAVVVFVRADVAGAIRFLQGKREPAPAKRRARTQGAAAPAPAASVARPAASRPDVDVASMAASLAGADAPTTPVRDGSSAPLDADAATDVIVGAGPAAAATGAPPLAERRRTVVRTDEGVPEGADEPTGPVVPVTQDVPPARVEVDEPEDEDLYEDEAFDEEPDDELDEGEAPDEVDLSGLEVPAEYPTEILDALADETERPTGLLEDEAPDGSERPTGVLSEDELADETERPTGVLVEGQLEDDSERPTGVLAEEASERPTGLLVEEESERATGLLVEEELEEESERATGLLVEESEDESERATGLLVEEESERATGLLAGEAEEESERSTGLLVEGESERSTGLLAEEESERATDLLEPEEEFEEEPEPEVGPVPAGGVAQQDEEGFCFILKQNVIVVHTTETL